MKNITLTITSMIENEIRLTVCALVKEVIERYSSFGEFSLFPSLSHFQKLKAKSLTIECLLCIWCCLKCQTVIWLFARLLSVYEIK